MKLLALSALLLCLSSIGLSAQPYQRLNRNDLTAAQVNGTWSNGRNLFKVRMLSDGHVRLIFEGTYPYRTADGERMANIGTFDGVASVNGSVATISNVNESPECTITLTFKGGKLKVEQEGLCGFGNGVTADGTYKRKSRRAPYMPALPD